METVTCAPASTVRGRLGCIWRPRRPEKPGKRTRLDTLRSRAAPGTFPPARHERETRSSLAAAEPAEAGRLPAERCSRREPVGRRRHGRRPGLRGRRSRGRCMPIDHSRHRAPESAPRSDRAAGRREGAAPAAEPVPKWMRCTGLERLRRHVAAGADQRSGPAPGTWAFRCQLAVVLLLALAAVLAGAATGIAFVRRRSGGLMNGRRLPCPIAVHDGRDGQCPGFAPRRTDTTVAGQSLLCPVLGAFDRHNVMRKNCYDELAPRFVTLHHPAAGTRTGLACRTGDGSPLGSSSTALENR